MSFAKAIRVGETMPDGYKEMERAFCDHCDAEYSIVHDEKAVDEAQAIKQAEHVAVVLTGEHVDEKFHEHLRTYEPLD